MYASASSATSSKLGDHFLLREIFLSISQAECASQRKIRLFRKLP